MAEIALVVDADSYPKKCRALEALFQILDRDLVDIKHLGNTSPSGFFRDCKELSKTYDLVIPCTRNLFIRDHLYNQGVDIVLTV